MVNNVFFTDQFNKILYKDTLTIFEQELKDMINNSVFQSVSYGQQLLLLCKMFTTKVEIKKQQKLLWGKMRLTLFKGQINASDVTEQELMTYGAQLIFIIREFFTGEQLLYHFGGTDSKGNFLGDALIPQQEVLKNLSAVGKKAIGVTSAIQKSFINDGEDSVVNSNLWNKVLQLSEIANDNQLNYNSKAIVNKKAVFQHSEPDENIYAYFTKKRKQLIMYYNIQSNDFIPINRGWLWEWYNSIMLSNNDEMKDYVIAGLEQNTLAPMILSPDFVRGTKEGDYVTAKNQHVQSKYNNLKIISYNNILNIMYDFTTVLNMYLAGKNPSIMSQNLLNILNKHFIPSAVAKESQNLNNIVNDELLRKLTTK